MSLSKKCLSDAVFWTKIKYTGFTSYAIANLRVRELIKLTTISDHTRQFTNLCNIKAKVVHRNRSDNHCNQSDACPHSSIAFWHLPPNSARYSYATEGARFISVQLSTDMVSTLQKVWVLIRLQKQPSTQART